MEKKIRITAKGLDLLERIIRSCPPRMSNSGLEAKRVLYDISKNGEAIFFDQFVRRLGITDLSGSVFGHFYEVASLVGVGEIDERFVVEYFSGEFHSSEIARKIERGDIELMKQVDPFYEWRVIVAHLLMPGFLEEVSETGFSVRYENGDISFIIGSLLPYGSDFLSFEKDMLVWVHLSSIIGRADPGLANVALESQKGNKLFREACTKVAKSGMDARALIQYSSWAKKACELFCE